MRLVGRGLDVYQYLEPLYNDYRKVKMRLPTGQFVVTHMDEVRRGGLGAARGTGAGRGPRPAAGLAAAVHAC